jgi:hypothetical protein
VLGLDVPMADVGEVQVALVLLAVLFLLLALVPRAFCAVCWSAWSVHAVVACLTSLVQTVGGRVVLIIHAWRTWRTAGTASQSSCMDPAGWRLQSMWSTPESPRTRPQHSTCPYHVAVEPWCESQCDGAKQWKRVCPSAHVQSISIVMGQRRS